MFGIFVQGARTVEDLLVLLIVVTLCARLIDVGNKVIWSAVVVLTRFESIRPISSVVPMETAVVVAAIVMAANVLLSVVVVVVVAAKRAISARIFIKTYLCFLNVGVLVGGCDHLADAGRWLSVELRAEFTVMKTSDEGGDDFGFRDVGNRIPHLGETSDVAAE